MYVLFAKLLSLSFTSSFLILAVILIRFVLKKAPKWIICMLWGLVAIRLICPVSLESRFSLVPNSVGSGEIVSEWLDGVSVLAGREPVSNGEDGFYAVTAYDQLGEPKTVENTIIPIVSWVWMAGVVCMLLYAMISFFRLHKQLKTATIYRRNIKQSERVDSPFVLGIVRPTIYIPYQISERDLKYVIAHEKAHIRRRDHWWKPLGFVLLALYWFHPLCWIAYILLCRDIESACDEKVIREMEKDERRAYSTALLNCSVHKRSIAACPLAFGEVGVKERVIGVMNYKKPAFGVIIVAILICVITAVCFLTKSDNIGVDERLAAFIDCEIASHHQTAYSGDYFCCLDWEVIGKEKQENQTTLYMWVLYREYDYDGQIHVESGAYILTAITVEEVDGSYHLVEYWESKDGSYYTDSIKENVPMFLWGKAMDSQRYFEMQSEKLDELAMEHFSSDTANESTPDKITYMDPSFEPEAEKCDLIPMVMVGGKLYLDTGHESTVEARCGMMDGEITSAVDGSEQPTENNQSNFGTGYGYQYGPVKGTIEIYMNKKWWVFATEEVRQEIQFPSEESNTPQQATGHDLACL